LKRRRSGSGGDGASVSTAGRPSQKNALAGVQFAVTKVPSAETVGAVQFGAATDDAGKKVSAGAPPPCDAGVFATRGPKLLP